MQPEIFVSIDDGHPLDLKVADILQKKKLEAIFYIPIKNSEGLPTLRRRDILYLSKHFEVGAHTYNHIDLTKVPRKVAREEIRRGKQTLEDIIGKKIYSFCPPKGNYNEEIINIIKSLGFKNIRTARIINFCYSDSPGLIWHPNLHIFPHAIQKDLLHCIKNKDFYSLKMRLRHLNLSHIQLVDVFKEKHQPFHIWLHSWEIEKYGLWGVLKKL